MNIYIYIARTWCQECHNVGMYCALLFNTCSTSLSDLINIQKETEGVNFTIKQILVTFAAMRIHISQTTKECLDLLGGYLVQRRGPMEIKVQK